MSLRLFLSFAMFSFPAFGQEQPVKTRILTLSLDREFENAFFMNAGDVEPFVAERSGLSEPFEYTGARQFALRASATEFAAAPPLPPPLASVALPAGSELVLLVGMHAPDGKMRLAAYDASPAGFRAGDYRVFNFSEMPIMAILGRGKLSLKPGESRVVADAAMPDKSVDMVVQIAQVENGKPRRVYASAWGHKPTKRNYIFLFRGSHPTRPIAIRRFSDFPE